MQTEQPKSNNPMDEIILKEQREALKKQIRDETESAAAKEFAASAGPGLKYVHNWKKWIFWNGTKWEMMQGDSGTGEAFQAVGIWNEKNNLDKFLAARDAGEEPEELKRLLAVYNKYASLRGIELIIKLAKREPALRVNSDQINKKHLVLNCLNGSIDLSSPAVPPKLQPNDPKDLITQVAGANYEQEADCPLWNKFLVDIFAGDNELIEFIQRLVGYSLSGATDEQILPILYGDGRNGKSVFLDTVAALLGDYSASARAELLMPERFRGHPTELTSLFGKRFVHISEPSEGAALDEGQVKSLTGDKSITARRMGEDFWTFDRTHIAWVATNHKPTVRGTDYGIWRRLLLIPFDVDVADLPGGVDKNIAAKLLLELPGILTWAVTGYLDWLGNGLRIPESVQEHSEAYRAEQDIIGTFIENHCFVGEGKSCFADEIFKHFQERTGSRISQHKFGRKFGKHFPKERTQVAGVRNTVYRGVAIQN